MSSGTSVRSAARGDDMATVYVDNQPYQMNPTQNLLHGCLSLGMNLPYFCWHPAMGSSGTVDCPRTRSPCHLHGQRFSLMCRSKSARKYFNALCSGSAAPGARAQKV